MKPAYSEKRLQLLDTAERLFSEKGFDGTSVRDIAEEAGINTAMISYYFGSKEKLMEAIFEERSLNVREKVDLLLKDDSLDPLQKMYRLLDEYVEKIMQRKKFHRILLCEQVINQNPIIIEMLAKIKSRNLSSINDVIRLGQKKGLFKKQVDVPMMMNTLIGTISHMLVNLDFYKAYHHLETLTDEEFEKTLKKKLSAHIKIIFKAILSHES
ncbi:MAG: TetR/AcrR family transcriptional regulator [Bacteroidota bacterium]|nr:TetR/AcrR family transcriptional regulator [Bacteroidota bacterium]MDP4212024.1 TetR/AcrR family transcriptional regulator [Bacteroidota bacterium]MDP4249960.1 TetR/AcrR family transcriptional regulator [Bacteroidota bacterium]